MNQGNIDGEHFDPTLAPATRAKPRHLLSPMDSEWITTDQVLNPTAWGWRRGIHPSVGPPPSNINLQGVSLIEENTELPLGRWKCPFKREEILCIWSHTEHESLTVDELRCMKLLIKYNGPYNAGDFPGSDKYGNTAQVEIVAPAEDTKFKVLRELDTAIHCRDDFMESSVLHVIPQRFPTKVLRLNLERELDRLLKQEIFANERGHPLFYEESDSESETSSSDDENATNKKFQRIEQQADKRIDWLSATAKNMERKTLFFDKANASGIEKAEEMKILGFGGCLACKNNPCVWKETVGEDMLQKRLGVLNKEILHVKNNAEKEMMESIVARSAIQGGDTLFNKTELLHELKSERKEIDDSIRLHRIDKELHNANSTRHRFIEVQALHGYTTLMPTEKAVKALEYEHNRLIASSVARDVVDDIVEWRVNIFCDQID